MADYLDNNIKDAESVTLLKDSPEDSLDTPILIDVSIFFLLIPRLNGC